VNGLTGGGWIGTNAPLMTWPRAAAGDLASRRAVNGAKQRRNWSAKGNQAMRVVSLLRKVPTEPSTAGKPSKSPLTVACLLTMVSRYR